MGFFDKLSDMVKDSNNPWSGDYRKIYFDNTPSNNGWYKCAHCGKSFRKEDLDIDHILPKSLGGGNDIHNLQALCKHCNRSKGNKMNDSISDFNRRVKEENEKLEELKTFEKYLKKNK